MATGYCLLAVGVLFKQPSHKPPDMHLSNRARANAPGDISGEGAGCVSDATLPVSNHSKPQGHEATPIGAK